MALIGTIELEKASRAASSLATFRSGHHYIQLSHGAQNRKNALFFRGVVRTDHAEREPASIAVSPQCGLHQVLKCKTFYDGLEMKCGELKAQPIA